MALSQTEVDALERFAKEIRVNLLETLNQLGFGHYGGSLSITIMAPVSPHILIVI